jgi:hypothetical protein
MENGPERHLCVYVRINLDLTEFILWNVCEYYYKQMLTVIERETWRQNGTYQPSMFPIINLYLHNKIVHKFCGRYNDLAYWYKLPLHGPYAEWFVTYILLECHYHIGLSEG